MSSRVSFRESLGSLRADVHWLGRMAEDAVRDASRALFADDRRRAEAVIAGDNELDDLFLELEQRAYSIIAQQAPVAVDLRFLVSSLRVMADFERIGDLAVAITKLALGDWEREPGAVELLAGMAELSLDVLAAAREAWLTQDLLSATALGRRDEELDASYLQLVGHLLGQRGPDVSSLVMNALLIGRNLERIADHAVAVGGRVLYTLTGSPDSLAAEIR